ncbi:hypothetical protein TSAR_001577 [Trichomalopsis sarcophagae]|uniref:Uncharacterized protein n=1 Tax=Trichomalopsis sarcophagae TaxID=543379 RepID=A0A232F2Y8_9HYME|nr:hypothetical protein TSAR_001577 [Trichomalopsis sarcophagae]
MENHQPLNDLSWSLPLNMYLAPHLFGLSAILVLPMLPRTREAGGSKAKHEKASAAASHSNGHVHKDK